MPNLKHDPQNPADLLGRPIAEGDVVAWGTTWGRSPAVCVAVIEKIRFVYKPPGAYKNMECPQADADDYTLRLRPIYSTGDITYLKPDGDEYRQYRDGHMPVAQLTAKSKNVIVVNNVVKLDKTEQEILDTLTANGR